ncbi:MAG: T9SS type A sorting domain-containing protein [Saprospiraceae bacterium]|nr:T9SS type A sorting domain-containing protein [Saprospiraceae bacterium]
MKKLYFLLLLVTVLGANVSAQAPGLFEKYYGNSDDNRPTAVKHFGDGVYVSGYSIINGAEYGTFTKFDETNGSIVWQRYVELQSRLVDFEYDPVNDAFLVVGYTFPFSAGFDNRSLLIKIDDATGNATWVKSFNMPGREQFNRIVRHPNPLDPNNPYFISGTKNPITTPSSNDVVVLYNVNDAGTVNFATEYAYSTNPTDDEFHRGLIPYTNGNLVLTGNSTSNDGIVMEVSGFNGAVVRSIRYGYPIDINGGVLMPNGNLVLVGEDFTNPSFNHNAVMLLLSPSFTTLSRFQFDNITRFEDAWVDQNGLLYAIGPSKTTPQGLNYQVVHQLSYQQVGPFFLVVNWARYLDPALPLPYDVFFDDGNISVTPAHDRIFYADSRITDPTNPPLFGGKDMLVGSYDLNLASGCKHDFPSPVTLFNMPQFNINVAWTPFTAPQPQMPPVVKPLLALEKDFCVSAPCECDFTVTYLNCFKAQFTANCQMPMGGNYTYTWDFDTSVPGAQPPVLVPSSTHTVSNMYDCGGGTYQVSLTVTTPGGIMCTIVKTITVPSDCCGPILTQAASCTQIPNTYKFVIEVDDPPGVTACQQPSIVVNNSVATIISSPTFTYDASVTSWLINGFVQLTSTANTSALNFTISSSCTCAPPSNAMTTCTQQVNIPLPCCKSIVVNDTTLCHDLAKADIPVNVGAWPPLNNITQVSWYVIPQPAGGCPPIPWGSLPYQDNLTNVMEPLHLYPSSLKDQVYCVYAVIYLNDGPCHVLTSNTATINLCDPTTCSLDDQEHCYLGSPVQLDPINLTLNASAAACPREIYWYDNHDNLVQTGGFTYTPTTLLSMIDPTQCFEDFFYKVEVVDSCGTHTCTSRIRLYSGTASVGTLIMDPDEPPFLCYNGDATLTFDPKCAGDPPNWKWLEQDCNGGSVTPITDAGTMNTLFNTGQLTTSQYYYVEAINGPCPAKTEQLFVPVKAPLSYSSFLGSSDDCVESFVTLDLMIEPCVIDGCIPSIPCSCTYTVEWFKDGFPIGTTPNTLSGMVSFTYNTMPLAGNYYAVISSDCCAGETVTTTPVLFEPSCDPCIMGPCFICNNEKVTLMAQMKLPPDDPCPTASICTFTWYQVDTSTNIWTQVGTGDMFMTMVGGHYLLQSNCNGCIKTVPYDLPECTSGPCVRVHVEDLHVNNSPVRLFPNPTSGDVTVEWIGSEIPKERRLSLVDMTGRVLTTIEVPNLETLHVMHFDDLPSGMYFLKVTADGKEYTAAKLYKE